MEQEYSRAWPDYWPPPDVFFGALAANIAGVHAFAQLRGRQVIVRFKNHYGVKISQSRFLEGLYVVAALKFHGPRADQYEFAGDAHVPDPTWCFSNEEVFTFCQEVALWQGN